MEISFTELKETLAQVAEKEKCIDDLIDSLNEQLAALNLEIPVWLMDDPIFLFPTIFQEEKRQDGSIRRWLDATFLGYDQVGDEWQLATREVELELRADGLKRKWGVAEVWQLHTYSWHDSDSPRQVILLIPKLIRMMAEKAENFLEIVEQIGVFAQRKKSSDRRDASS